MTVSFLKNVSFKAIVSSDSVEGAYYIVEKKENEEGVTCTCPDFHYRKGGKGDKCKHIKMVLDLELF